MASVLRGGACAKRRASSEEEPPAKRQKLSINAENQNRGPNSSENTLDQSMEYATEASAMLVALFEALHGRRPVGSSENIKSSGAGDDVESAAAVSAGEEASQVDVTREKTSPAPATSGHQVESMALPQDEKKSADVCSTTNTASTSSSTTGYNSNNAGETPNNTTISDARIELLQSCFPACAATVPGRRNKNHKEVFAAVGELVREGATQLAQRKKQLEEATTAQWSLVAESRETVAGAEDLAQSAKAGEGEQRMVAEALQHSVSKLEEEVKINRHGTRTVEQNRREIECTVEELERALQGLRNARDSVKPSAAEKDAIEHHLRRCKADESMLQALQYAHEPASFGKKAIARAETILDSELVHHRDRLTDASDSLKNREERLQGLQACVAAEVANREVAEDLLAEKLEVKHSADAAVQSAKAQLREVERKLQEFTSLQEEAQKETCAFAQKVEKVFEYLELRGQPRERPAPTPRSAIKKPNAAATPKSVGFLSSLFGSASKVKEEGRAMGASRSTGLETPEAHGGRRMSTSVPALPRAGEVAASSKLIRDGKHSEMHVPRNSKTCETTKKVLAFEDDSNRPPAACSGGGGGSGRALNASQGSLLLEDDEQTERGRKCNEDFSFPHLCGKMLGENTGGLFLSSTASASSSSSSSHQNSALSSAASASSAQGQKGVPQKEQQRSMKKDDNAPGESARKVHWPDEKRQSLVSKIMSPVRKTLKRLSEAFLPGRQGCVEEEQHQEASNKSEPALHEEIEYEKRDSTSEDQVPPLWRARHEHGGLLPGESSDEQ
ncbi:unnamed protein product [Amoebophrya sp. A25]|nr:unnamed protein product [Amoebophrya sp. A25]|eukprot:GSA25T00001767001.1